MCTCSVEEELRFAAIHQVWYAQIAPEGTDAGVGATLRPCRVFIIKVALTQCKLNPLLHVFCHGTYIHHPLDALIITSQANDDAEVPFFAAEISPQWRVFAPGVRSAFHVTFARF